MSVEVYSVANDTLLGSVNTRLLMIEVLEEASILTSLSGSPFTSGDVLSIPFKSTPTSSELAALGSVVSAHDGSTAPPAPMTITPVLSVNGEVGDVVLTAPDVGAVDSAALSSAISSFVTSAGAASAAPVQSVNGAVGVVSLDAASVGADAAGTSVAGVSAHESAVDPHAGYQRGSEKGVAGGYSSLDASGKIPVSQLPNDGDLVFIGFWNAATNTPAVVSSVGSEGDLYRVQVAGSTTIDGESVWIVGDQLIFKNGVWVRWATGVTGATFPTLIGEGEDTSYRSTSSDSNWMQAQRLSFTAPAAGRYRIAWGYMWSLDSTKDDFRCRVQLHGAATVDLYGNREHRQRPKHSGGSGSGGTDKAYPVKFDRFVTIAAGSYDVDIDFRPSDDKTAGIHFSSIQVWRES